MDADKNVRRKRSEMIVDPPCTVLIPRSLASRMGSRAELLRTCLSAEIILTHDRSYESMDGGSVIIEAPSSRPLSKSDQSAVFCKMRIAQLACMASRRRFETKRSLRNADDVVSYWSEVNRYRAMLVDANIGICVTLATMYSKSRAAIEDYIQEGALALSRAIDRYDSVHGHAFSTFAYCVVRRQITGRACKVVNIRGETVDQNENLSPGGREEDPSTLAEHAEVVCAVNRLPFKLRDVISRHFGIGCRRETLAQIGKRHGRTKEWVRRVQVAALDELRILLA